MTPDEYCQDKAARSGSSFYYAFFIFAPAAQARYHGVIRLLPGSR